MADILDKETRSWVMSRVRSKNNASTELKLAAVFRELGIKGWRRGFKIIGKPDFVFPKLKIAVFADGCFWHGHDCRTNTPKTHKRYWTPKIARNKQRDLEVSKILQSKGWRVIRVWECELKNKNRAKLLKKLRPLFPHSRQSLLSRLCDFLGIKRS
ncbi:MAG: very short patch repair endonuclease [Rickettsiales bacterium]|jgi:DNA mismatch endonuclease (patch repair protein)|nr:very short patch repair endonuclease [Rickettsiales bacterium]